MTTTRLTIDELGAQGDGIATFDGQSVFVPGALPGEIVNGVIDGNRASDVAVIEMSAQRAEPPCPHFGRCGGCRVQHMAEPLYRIWKKGLVESPLARAGLTVEVAEPILCTPGSRRRATFSVRNVQSHVELGFMALGSHEIVDQTTCLIVTPGIDQLRDDLRSLAATCVPPGKKGLVTVLETSTGHDVSFRVDHALSDGVRKGLTRSTQSMPVIRLTYNGEVLIARDTPRIAIGDVTVGPAPGAFVQAVAEIEMKMAHMVMAHLKSCKTVVDLFAGSGTFALRLASRATVHAVEGDGASLTALDNAWRDHASALKLRKVSCERRDLYRSPVPARDLDDYSGLVFDPPRAGALAQCEQIAKSGITRVAAVSCNPETLARDLKILVDAGFNLDAVQPFDQFLWSSHVEVVALLSRKTRRKRPGLG